MMRRTLSSDDILDLEPTIARCGLCFSLCPIAEMIVVDIDVPGMPMGICPTCLERHA